MPIYAYAIVIIGLLLWFIPFPLTGWSSTAPQQRDRRARWGILLQSIAYALLFLGEFWTRSPGVWRVALSISFLALASLLSWTATRALGRHLRFDAALGADHELIRSGPYRVVRHPIYTSMLCLLLGLGCMVAPLSWLLVAIGIFICGTEIRVRIEDKLLASHFGQQFRDYRSAVSAYVPFVR